MEPFASETHCPKAIMDASSLYESALIIAHNGKEELCQATGEALGQQLRETVHEIDGTIILQHRGSGPLRNRTMNASFRR